MPMDMNKDYGMVVNVNNKQDYLTVPIVVIVNGYPTSGKDTFCEFAGKKYNITNYSTVETVKKLATDMGWNGEKTPRNRDMLSALKDFYVEWFDGTFIEMTQLINDKYRHRGDKFIFLHIREPEEIKRMVKWCADTFKVCHTVFIDREVEIEHGNHADANVVDFKYDIYVYNDSTLEEFEKKSLDIFKKMIYNDI